MLEKQKIDSRIVAVIIMAAAAITRFFPHPFNFTAIGAIALFAGANFKDRRYVYLVPVLIMFLTDLLLGLHFSMLPVYTCFAITVWVGTKISNRQTIFTILGSSLLCSVIFFLVTNLPVWYLDLKLYPMTFAGTMESYKMAIPFFQNQAAGDVLYSGVLFGCYHLYRKYSITGRYSAISLKK